MALLVCSVGAMSFSAPTGISRTTGPAMRCSPAALTTDSVVAVSPTTLLVLPKGCPTVPSWYDAGMRLTDEPAALPVSKTFRSRNAVISWYDGGITLVPLPDAAEPVREPATDPAPEPSESAVTPELDIDELVVAEQIGVGTQSQVLLGKLPGFGPVAVKIGLKMNAIAREAVVLSAMSGAVGFPQLLHFEAEGARAPGGFLVVDLLGPSVEDLLRSGREHACTCLSGPTLLRLGRGVLRRLRQLHLAGYVHNDVKPANLLLGKGSSSTPTRLHLIDFGSATRADDHAGADEATARPNGPIGTALFASVAADDCQQLMRPADDIESLVYTLSYLAAGSLPWKGRPDSHTLSMKRELLMDGGVPAGLTGDVGCAASVAALEALWAEVRRCNGSGHEGTGTSVDYDACLAALGGVSLEMEAEEADALSEDCLVQAASSQQSGSHA